MSAVENTLTTVESKFAFQVNLIDALLGKLRAFFGPETCRKHMSIFRTVGHAGTVVAGALGLLFSVVAAIKSDSFVLFLLGLGWLAGILIMDYVSRRFGQTSDSLVSSTRSFLSSTIYVDAIALILLVAAIGLWDFGVYGAIKSGGISFFLKTGAIAIGMFYLSLITLNAATMLNVEIKSGLKAEEEGVGLLEFGAKSCLLAVPFFFGSGIVFGLIQIIWNLVSAARGESFASALFGLTPYFITISAVASLPFLACVIFLIFYALIAAVKSLIRMASLLEKKEA